MLLAALFALAQAPRPLDVVLRIDAPAAVAPAFTPPFQVELSFVAENAPGHLTFSGRCPWEDPRRALAYRWKAGLLLDRSVRPRALKDIRYLIKDRAGRTVLAFRGRNPPPIHAGSLAGIVLHLSVGTLGEPGGAVDHQVELEF